jgi:hypothetical protein
MFAESVAGYGQPIRLLPTETYVQGLYNQTQDNSLLVIGEADPIGNFPVIQTSYTINNPLIWYYSQSYTGNMYWENLNFDYVIDYDSTVAMFIYALCDSGSFVMKLVIF